MCCVAGLDRLLLGTKSKTTLDGEWQSQHQIFYRVPSSKRKFDAIYNIVVDGELHVEDISTKEAIVHFYEQLYLENIPLSPFLEGISMTLLV